MTAQEKIKGNENYLLPYFEKTICISLMVEISSFGTSCRKVAKNKKNVDVLCIKENALTYIQNTKSPRSGNAYEYIKCICVFI